MKQRRTVRTGSTRDGEQVEETDGRSPEGSDHADSDQPDGAIGEEARSIDELRSDVENETGHPGTDGHRDEHRMKRVSVRTGQRCTYWRFGLVQPARYDDHPNTPFANRR
jgi:hypothetical protein